MEVAESSGKEDKLRWSKTEIEVIHLLIRLTSYHFPHLPGSDCSSIEGSNNNTIILNNVHDMMYEKRQTHDK